MSNSSDPRTNQLSSRLKQPLLRLLALAIPLLYASHTWLYRHYAVDDAFITFRYIQQWLAGNGLVFNIGERVEGYSNFLWLVAVTLLRLVGLDFITAARVLGFGLGLITLVLVARLTRQTRWPVAAPLLLASLAPFVAWGMGGLETPLFALLLTAGVLAYLREEEHSQGWTSGLWLSLLALTRPEGAIYILVIAAFRLWRLWRRRQWPQNQDVIRAAILGVLVGGFYLWKLLYYGDIIPNTVHAKAMGLHPRALMEGAYYLYQSVVASGGLWVVLVAALALWPKRSWQAALIGWLTLTWAALALLSGGDWMPLQRFLVHILPLLCVMFVWGLEALVQRLRLPLPTAVMLLVIVAQVAFNLATSVDARLIQKGVPVRRSGIPTSYLYVAERARPGDTVAVVDAGEIATVLPLSVRVLDMVGLTDAHIAGVAPSFPSGLLGRGDGFGRWDIDYVLAQKPAFVLVHYFGEDENGHRRTDFTGSTLLINDPRFVARYRWKPEGSVFQRIAE